MPRIPVAILGGSGYTAVELIKLLLRHPGAEIAAIIAEEGFDYLDGPVIRVTGPDVPGVPYNHVLEDWFMPNPDRIAEAVRRLAAY